jgi:ectoine hydroxylase-related dioxygenase (phytanoyl-CoA dioxygenase family)
MQAGDNYNDNGFENLVGFYDKHALNSIASALEHHQVFSYNFPDIDSHNLFNSVVIINELVHSQKILSVVKSIIGNTAVPFYSIVLDKTKNNNWGLDWHQDLKIAVKRRVDSKGYFNWSEESGITHVIPPVAVLAKMLTVRIHLDDCDGTNGAIWAIPSSHKIGIINKTQVQKTVEENAIYGCSFKAGDVMLMSPLLLHKSPYSLSDRPRRILQIEYRATSLENGLEWYN